MHLYLKPHNCDSRMLRAYGLYWCDCRRSMTFNNHLQLEPKTILSSGEEREFQRFGYLFAAQKTPGSKHLHPWLTESIAEWVTPDTNRCFHGLFLLCCKQLPQGDTAALRSTFEPVTLRCSARGAGPFRPTPAPAPTTSGREKCDTVPQTKCRIGSIVLPARRVCFP